MFSTCISCHLCKHYFNNHAQHSLVHLEVAGMEGYKSVVSNYEPTIDKTLAPKDIIYFFCHIGLPLHERKHVQVYIIRVIPGRMVRDLAVQLHV